MTLKQSASVPKSPDPNIPQREAATPDYDIWVAASAGSGKTKVLTDRVLRLLLPDPKGRWSGSAPHRILCITFTKAGAAQMSLRVQKKLGEWAVMPEAELYSELEKIINEEPSADMMAAARKLFSTVLDVTGGLPIMTIHSFCQSVLGRFAIEAGVTPGFTVLDERAAHDLLRRIIDELIKESDDSSDTALREAFARIATYMDIDRLRTTLLAIMGKSREFREFLALTGGSSENARAYILSALGYQNLQSEEEIYQNFVDALVDEDLLYIARVLVTGANTYKNMGDKIATWLALPRDKRGAQIPLLLEAFLTKDKQVRSIGSKLEKSNPEVLTMMGSVYESYCTMQDKIAALAQTAQTMDLLSLVGICLSRYVAGKKKHNALDFNDLILKTRELLENQSLQWVQYKLDEGIDHILVDEAQDTNIHQWMIVKQLSDEFLSGQGDDRRHRSLFVVGDEKQSIFSFHGADPKAFQDMRDFFSARSTEVERDFRSVRLETSFRSTVPVLKLVDTVFDNPHYAARLGLSTSHKLVHYSHQDKASGLVEIWPLVLRKATSSQKEDYNWNLPPVSVVAEGDKAESEDATGSPLATQIAHTIWGWLQSGEKLKSRNRPIEPRDILILVRTRNSFIGDLVRQLKLRGVPVSGIDRMKLTDQISIMDCLSLARFARFPDDDLSLACLLKSPFVRLSEEELMSLALGRSGTLWAEVKSRSAPELRNWLQEMIETANTHKPFDFFDNALNRACPFMPDLAQGKTSISGWQAFARCLGGDCIDPLDEFLTYCLTKEADGIFSVEEFISDVQRSDIIIKRDGEGDDKDGINQIRIMTVHGSKGLEAPIVILPDTIGVPDRKRIEPLQWKEQEKTAARIPLWSAGADKQCKAYKQMKEEAYEDMLSEHLRLLYVALTRPEDRLYIMGEAKSENSPELSWYALVRAAFSKLPDVQNINGVLRYETAQSGDLRKERTEQAGQSEDMDLPDWIARVAPSDEIISQRIIRPSAIGTEEDTIRTPLASVDGFRFRRGILTHKLFEILPDIPTENRETVARNFLRRSAGDLPVDMHETIIAETLGILSDPVFADVFAPGSFSEVPITGDIGAGQQISGQIDRLVIKHNEILIVDYKTNRPSPLHHSDIPASYISQLKAYKTAISAIYPGKIIKCALLWTDQPVLMPVDV